MKKLESLSEEQLIKMDEVKKYWLDYIFSCKNQINKQAAKIGIDWIYNSAKYNSPVIIYVESPLGCQYAVSLLKYLLKDNLGANVWANLGANVRDNVGANVGANFEQFGSYGNIGDYGWVSFYDFFTQIGVINHEKFNQFKSLIQSGIYDTIQLQGFCIVSNLPDKIKRNRFGRLHCEDGSAIHFRDTYELFYWNGVNVPQNWIMDKDSITKEVIMKESNAEKRRVLREILGAKKYYDIITDGNGLNTLDEDQDNQGNIMRLYETKVPDSVLNKNVQFLECVCPSTLRVYNIYPPSQNTKNVWEAKANTFGKTQKEFNPVLES